MDQFPHANITLPTELQKSVQDNSRKSENLESRVDLLEKSSNKSDPVHRSQKP